MISANGEKSKKDRYGPLKFHFSCFQEFTVQNDTIRGNKHKVQLSFFSFNKSSAQDLVKARIFQQEKSFSGILRQ